MESSADVKQNLINSEIDLEIQNAFGPMEAEVEEDPTVVDLKVEIDSEMTSSYGDMDDDAVIDKQNTPFDYTPNQIIHAFGNMELDKVLIHTDVRGGHLQENYHYESIETFSLLYEPRLWYTCKAVRVEFIWMDDKENMLWLFLLDKFGQKIGAIVPQHLIPAYLGRNLEGGVFSLKYFQVDYTDPNHYPRLDNYSFVRNDWAIMISNKTRLMPTMEGEEIGFTKYPLVPSIEQLVEECTTRQMLIDVVGKLKEVSLKTYLNVIDAGSKESCELFLEDCLGRKIKLVLHHIPRGRAFSSMIGKASVELVSVYVARVKLTRTQEGNVLESTDVTKVEFNPLVYEARELKRIMNLC